MMVREENARRDVKVKQYLQDCCKNNISRWTQLQAVLGDVAYQTQLRWPSKSASACSSTCWYASGFVTPSLKCDASA